MGSCLCRVRYLAYTLSRCGAALMPRRPCAGRPTPETSGRKPWASSSTGSLQANDAGDDAAMFDLERIEVIKGPQSALYGDSTFAGAINLMSRRPTENWAREIQGREWQRRVSLTVSARFSGPLGATGIAREDDRSRGGTSTAPGINVADPRNNLGGYRNWGIGSDPGIYTRCQRLAHHRQHSAEPIPARELPRNRRSTGPDYNCGARDRNHRILEFLLW